MNQKEIDINLKLINKSWEIFENKLRIKIEFSNFITAFDFMSEIAKVSEEIKHHPQWTNNYNKLEIVLWTHDKQAITSLDFILAKRIDQKMIELNKA
jgi:4a-hydroxytetrahydrobiopterin dehydratase|tara:strand:+ start:1312 stop:1602 length:291 start_codon:yes stop_codon:yes gene_type:complete